MLIGRRPIVVALGITVVGHSLILTASACASSSGSRRLGMRHATTRWTLNALQMGGCRTGFLAPGRAAGSNNGKAAAPSPPARAMNVRMAPGPPQPRHWTGGVGEPAGNMIPGGPRCSMVISHPYEPDYMIPSSIVHIHVLLSKGFLILQ